MDTQNIKTNRIVDQLYSARRTQLAGEVAYPLHKHDFAEIFWVDEGEMVHWINGETLTLEKGDCVFIRPHTDAHSLHSVHGNNPFWIVNTTFQWHVYETLRVRYFQDNRSIYAEEEPLPRVIRLGEQQIQRMRQELVSLLRAPNHPFYIERFLMNLLGECCDLALERDLIPDSAPSWLKDAWHAFQAPERFRKGASCFYRLCGRSHEHVSREFHRHTGRTLQECAHELKVQHAAALIAGTNREVVDVALECGFESLSHFYSSFKLMWGMTPRAYRIDAQKRMYGG